jgi:hypothetical protein
MLRHAATKRKVNSQWQRDSRHDQKRRERSNAAALEEGPLGIRDASFVGIAQGS